MTDSVDIREARPTDAPAIEALYPRTFPDEDLLPLVRDLENERTGVISLVALSGNALVAHVAFTTCGIDRSADSVALLAPLAVAPDRQRQGVGSALVRDGLRRLKDAGMTHVFTLGDPAYYSRFGFKPDNDVAPPYPLPEEWRSAWQSLNLSDDRPPQRGTLSVPPAWRRKELWAP